MTAIDPSRIALQAHIGLIRMNPASGVVALLLFLGATMCVAFALSARQDEPPRPQARLEGLPAATARESVDEQNLRKFYDVLGDRSETEQSLKTLFEIAKQAGLSLDQGEYQWRFDKQSSTYRYQVLLPVKGSYSAIRRFCERTLLALPFASLDEWSFKRESVNDDALDASLRFTLYLKDVPQALKKTGMAK